MTEQRIVREFGPSLPVYFGGNALIAVALLDLDVEALDFLIERAERDLEVLGGFGLVPVAALQAVGDDAPLNLFHDIKERGVGAMVEDRGGPGVAGELRRQQVGREG